MHQMISSIKIEHLDVFRVIFVSHFKTLISMGGKVLTLEIKLGVNILMKRTFFLMLYLKELFLNGVPIDDLMLR